MDCGREFALLLFVQQYLSQHRTNTFREPYLQTRSTQVMQVLLIECLDEWILLQSVYCGILFIDSCLVIINLAATHSLNKPSGDYIGCLIIKQPGGAM